MIVKQYDGGIVYTPFLGLDDSQKTSNTESEKKEDKIKDEIISVLKETGLPSDVDMFLSQANSFLNSSGTLLDSIGGTDYHIGKLIQLQSLANKVKFNNELHKTASAQIIKEGSGSEIALTNNGGMYVVNEEGNIKAISSSEYYENTDKYRPLTNSELIHLRENSPELAYRSSILTDLSNTVGM
jgi:hypothetical protein